MNDIVVSFPSGYAAQKEWTVKYKKLETVNVFSDRIVIKELNDLTLLFISEAILDEQTIVDEKIEQYVKERISGLSRNYLSNTGVKPDSLLSLPHMNPEIEPREHQLAGVESILRVRKGWLGDDLGAGKTLMSLAAPIAGEQLPCVCVVKPTTAGTWKKEQEKFFPELSSVILQGETPYEVEPANFYIIGYSVLQFWVPFLRSVDCKSFVFDEAHKLSDFRTHQSKAAAKLTKGLDDENIVLLITTTPLKKGPFQIWQHLIILDLVKHFGGDYNKFGDLFCERQKKFGRWDMSGASNLEHLHDFVLSSYMIRRLKQSYLPAELADNCGVEKNVYYCNMSDKEFRKYLRLKDSSNQEIVEILSEHLEVNPDLIEEKDIEQVVQKILSKKKFLLEVGDGNIRFPAKRDAAGNKIVEENHAKFTKTHMLSSYLNSIKLAYVNDFVENFMEEQPDEKLIVFARSRDMQRALAGVDLDEREIREFPFPKKEINRAKKTAKKMGAVTIFAAADQGLEAISDAIESFQTDDNVKMIVVSMGNVESHTLTAGWYILWADLPYSRSDEAQGEGRAAGRVNDPHAAFSWKTVMLGPSGETTVDNNLLLNIQSSKDITDAVLDGKILKSD